MTDNLKDKIMICRCEKGWYPIETPTDMKGRTLEEIAKANGELNDHIHSIETLDGEVLWKRKVH